LFTALLFAPSSPWFELLRHFGQILYLCFYIASRREEEEIWQAFCAFLRNHLDMKKHKSKLQSFVA